MSLWALDDCMSGARCVCYSSCLGVGANNKTYMDVLLRTLPLSATVSVQQTAMLPVYVVFLLRRTPHLLGAAWP